MSNTTEDEESVHPLVSNLLGQKFVPRISGETFRYDRDEMLRLKITPLSTTRPDILSTDFDGFVLGIYIFHYFFFQRRR